jgi:hypothetical protein
LFFPGAQQNAQQKERGKEREPCQRRDKTLPEGAAV